ncbi:MAG: lipopolysaccharide kinase InaA family protein, partial [Thermodesulfobacteriota bacterium]|nr:lipopolysaccharide kinase InaA family protein [Thermodesulfobacteriota bacterium]
MTMALTRTYDSYHFGSSSRLTDGQLDQLIGLFNAPTYNVDSVLGGRSSVALAYIEGLGSVVIKYYTRGGLLRFFVERTYLKLGRTRCQIEYELLQKARGLGVSVPEPIAYASRGSLFYRAWLVTKEIKGQQTLAQLALSDVERVYTVMGQVVDQVSILINNHILH